MDRARNILFLCTGNSARSILAEALLNRDGGDRFKACSAGSFPKGQVHPMALELLTGLGFPTSGLRSKSWDEFAAPNAPEIDVVITVCDNAAGEVCPIWPGKPITAHWGIEDPAAVEGEGQNDAFLAAFRQIEARLARLRDLPIETLGREALRNSLRAIGQLQDA